MSTVRRVCRYQREVIRIHISKKNRQHNGQMKSTKEQTTIYKHTYKTKKCLKTKEEIVDSANRLQEKLSNI